MSDRQTLKENQPADEEPEPTSDEAPKRYYYDDSTGYEKYDAESDQDEEEGCEGQSPGTES